MSMCGYLGHWLDKVVFFWHKRAPPGPPPGDDDLPVGSIALWSMKNGPIPAGWAECDGTQNAPGPDLRSRFIVGRSASKAVDTTGGSSTHGHPGHELNLTHDAHGGLVKHGTTATADTFTTPLTHAAHGGALVHGSVDHEPPFHVLVYIQRMS